jgi:enoyl-CoA hydratase
VGDVLVVEDPEPGVRVLRLDRPQARNALSVELRDRVSDAVDAIVRDRDVKAAVLTGTGAVFSAGFDLREFERAADDPDFEVALWASSDRFHHTVLRCPVPIVAALNGPALAGGFDLATLCDLRVAQPGAYMARPELTFAVPVLGPLRELVGGARARELCLTGRRVEPEEASRIGLVTEVTGPDGALPRALELAREIASRPGDISRRVKAKIVAATGLAGAGTLDL